MIFFQNILGVHPNKSFNAFEAENQRRKKVAASPPLLKVDSFLAQLQLELWFKDTEEKSPMYQLVVTATAKILLGV